MKKPIVLVIMDGVGRGDGGPGDAVAQAKTPVLDRLMATCPMTWLKAHGTATGCRGSTSGTGSVYAIEAAIAVACTAESGTINAPQKFLGTP